MAAMAAIAAMSAMAVFGHINIFSTVVRELALVVCKLYSDFASVSDFAFFEAFILAFIRAFECWLMTAFGPHCRHCKHLLME